MRLFFLLLGLSLFIRSWADTNTTQQLPDSLAQQLASTRGEARAEVLLHIGSWWAKQGDVGKALQQWQQAAALAIDSGNKRLAWKAKRQQAMLLSQHYAYERALKLWLELLEAFEKEGDHKEQSEALVAIGRLHLQMENFAEAEKALKQANDLAAVMSDKQLLAESWSALGDLFKHKGVLGQAKIHYKKALDAWINQKNVEKSLALASLIGQLSFQLGDYEGAILHFQLARDMHSQMGDMAGLASDLLYIGEAQLAQGYVDEAAQTVDAALELGGGTSMIRAKLLMLKAKMSESLKQALPLLRRAKHLLATAPAIRELPDVWEALAQQFADIGAFEQALEAAYQANEALVRYFDVERNRAMLELSKRFETQSTLREQQQRIEMLEMEKARSQLFRLMLLVVLGLLLVVAVVLWHAYRVKRKDNALLKEKNAQIEQARKAIEHKNKELEEMNAKLEVLNEQLVREIGERESVEKSSFARDRFLAIMSQEMRTPLNVITNLAHQLIEDTPRPDQKEQLRQLQFAANSLVVFMNDVLDFSRIEAGKLTLDSRPFPIKRWIKDIVEQYQLAAAQQQVKFNLYLDPKIPEWVEGDPSRINQILSNLLSLAIDRSPKQSVDLMVHLHELHPGEAIINLSLISATPLLSEKERVELQKHLTISDADQMESFSRADLSLVITKRLVDLQNGHIEITDKENTHTIMIFLPFKVAEAEDLQEGKQTADASSYDHLAGKRVLLAEDNKINQVVVANLLRKLGMEVVTANNGQEAVEAIRQADFDIVLMDIQMPEMDGYQATMEIRKMKDIRKREVPIIALTASAFLTEREKARLFGMNDHVGKPFSPEELIDKISHLLKVHAKG